MRWCLCKRKTKQAIKYDIDRGAGWLSAEQAVFLTRQEDNEDLKCQTCGTSVSAFCTTASCDGHCPSTKCPLHLPLLLLRNHLDLPDATSFHNGRWQADYVSSPITGSIQWALFVEEKYNLTTAYGECPLCYELMCLGKIGLLFDINPKKRRICNHVFHLDCIHQATQSDKDGVSEDDPRCPVCSTSFETVINLPSVEKDFVAWWEYVAGGSNFCLSLAESVEFITFLLKLDTDDVTDLHGYAATICTMTSTSSLSAPTTQRLLASLTYMNEGLASAVGADFAPSSTAGSPGGVPHVHSGELSPRPSFMGLITAAAPNKVSDAMHNAMDNATKVKEAATEKVKERVQTIMENMSGVKDKRMVPCLTSTQFADLYRWTDERRRANGFDENRLFGIANGKSGKTVSDFCDMDGNGLVTCHELIRGCVKTYAHSDRKSKVRTIAAVEWAVLSLWIGLSRGKSAILLSHFEANCAHRIEDYFLSAGYTNSADEFNINDPRHSSSSDEQEFWQGPRAPRKKQMPKEEKIKEREKTVAFAATGSDSDDDRRLTSGSEEDKGPMESTLSASIPVPSADSDGREAGTTHSVASNSYNFPEEESLEDFFMDQLSKSPESLMMYSPASRESSFSDEEKADYQEKEKEKEKVKRHKKVWKRREEEFWICLLKKKEKK